MRDESCNGVMMVARRVEAVRVPRAPHELDSATLRRCRDGDPMAFRAFVVRYQRPVFALLSRLLGHGHHIEDPAQETFLRAFRAFPRFDVNAAAKASTWILTIATRLALDLLKRRTPALDALPPPQPLPDPEGEMRRVELGRAIALAAESLSAEQRAVFVLTEFHGLSQADISLMVDVPEATVKTRLFRARERLRQALRGYARRNTMHDRDPDAEILDAWHPQEPSDDFAERVVAEAMHRRKPTKRSRWPTWLAVALAIAAAWTLWILAQPDETTGLVTAEARQELAIGDRVVAVLEAGATVAWKGEALEQRAGDVFYRVAPGSELVVQTPSGSVTVLGTCFRVRVFPALAEDEVMKRRDIKIAATALTLGAMTVVGVYEGKVRLTHAGQSVELGSGESAGADGSGVSRLAAGELDELGRARAKSTGEARAVGTSPADVAALEKRLGTLEGQRKALEKSLKQARADLDATAAGRPVRDRDAFDLDEKDWSMLAETGDIKYRLPCQNDANSSGWRPSKELVDNLGLAPDDADVIQDAYAASQKRMDSVWRKLCADAIGRTEVVDALGRNTCIHLVLNMARREDNEAAQEAMRQVGEMRAGQRPLPAEREELHPVVELFLGITGEMDRFEADLAETLGPAEAKRIAYADGMCAGTSQFGGGPR